MRRSPVYAEQQNVRVTGCVNFEGQFAMTHRTFRLSDLIQMAGGTTQEAYTKGARLIRKMSDEERLQRDKSNLNNQILLMERGLEKESFNYALADSILMLKTNSDDSYSVAINLDQALAEPGGPADLILRANDQLIIPEYSGVVKISGEVMSPTSVHYRKGATLTDYLNSAGGVTKQASRKRTYAIYMNGAVNKLGRTASGKDLQPGMEIVVPSKPIREGMTTAEISVLGTSVASLTTMIVALINLLK